MNGRLLPFGWWHFLNKGRTTDRVRVGFLGVKPEYQHTGVAAKLYAEHFDAAERRPQTGGEMGWILETNEPMNRGDGGDGRQGRQALPDLRARAIDSGSGNPHVPGFAGDAAVSTHALARVGRVSENSTSRARSWRRRTPGRGRRAAGPGARALP